MDCGYGADKIILGEMRIMKKVAVSGWLEDSNEDLIPLFKTIKTKEFNM
jgi:phosphoribosylformimino-5-aminoimidazole carboxamide ribotide isomerase